MKGLKLAKRGLTLLAVAPFLAALAQQESSAPRIDQLVQDLGEEPIDIRHYTVEVVIFRYAENVSVGNEVFVPDPPPVMEEASTDDDPLLDEEPLDEEPLDEEPLAVETDPATAAAGVEPMAEDDAERQAETAALAPATGRPVVEYLLLTEDALTMGDIIARLELLDAYDTIMHFGWTQTVFPEMEPKPIEIDSLAEPVPGLDGSFTLYLSRYLHLHVDLALDKPPAFDDPVAIEDPVLSFGDARMGYDLFDTGGAGKIRYRIQEDRIFKSGELRYFDHPKFGVLVKVARVEEAEPDELADDPLLPVQPAIE